MLIAFLRRILLRLWSHIGRSGTNDFGNRAPSKERSREQPHVRKQEDQMETKRERCVTMKIDSRRLAVLQPHEYGLLPHAGTERTQLFRVLPITDKKRGRGMLVLWHRSCQPTPALWDERRRLTILTDSWNLINMMLESTENWSVRENLRGYGCTRRSNRHQQVMPEETVPW